MGDNTVRHGEASGILIASKPTVEISPERLSNLLRNDGEPEAHTSETQRIETLPAIDLPDPDASPAATLAAGTTPPQFAHTLRREPAYTPEPTSATDRTDDEAAPTGARADAATTAIRRVRAPAATVPPSRADDANARDEIRTAADLPSARRPHRTSASPLIRHPVVRMAPLSAADAPHGSSTTLPPPLAVTVPIPITGLPIEATADGSQPHLAATDEAAPAFAGSARLDPALEADMAAAVQPTWVSLLAPVRAVEPTQEVSLADVLYVETIRAGDDEIVDEIADPDPAPPAAHDLTLAPYLASANEPALAASRDAPAAAHDGDFALAPYLAPISEPIVERADDLAVAPYLASIDSSVDTPVEIEAALAPSELAPNDLAPDLASDEPAPAQFTPEFVDTATASAEPDSAEHATYPASAEQIHHESATYPASAEDASAEHATYPASTEHASTEHATYPASAEPAHYPTALAPTALAPTAPPLGLALAATLEPRRPSAIDIDDTDESTLLDAEVLAAPPLPTPPRPTPPPPLAIITSESPGVALAATRSFELPALTVEPRDVEHHEPSVVIDAEIGAEITAAIDVEITAATPAPTIEPSPVAEPVAPTTTATPPAEPAPPATSTAPAFPPPATRGSAPPRELSPLDLLVTRRPGPPVAAHPTWATKRITAPRHFLVPALVLAAMIAALYGIACAMF